MPEPNEPNDFAYLRLPHDSAFKLFVQHPTFIRHMLRAFPIPSIVESEIAHLRSEPANFVGLRLDQRYVDAAWEVEMTDRALAYLLIECQSTVDLAMHGRMTHAAGILVRRLSLRPPRDRGYTASRNPLIRGLVVYNGEPAWNAVMDSQEAAVASTGADRRYDPSFRYRVLDLRRVELPGGEWNAAVLQCELQVCDSPDELHKAAGPLRKLLDP